MVERPTGQIEPRASELGLKAEPERHPLRRGPCLRHDNGEDDGNLPPEYFGLRAYRLQLAREVEPIRKWPNLQGSTIKMRPEGYRILSAVNRMGDGGIMPSLFAVNYRESYFGCGRPLFIA